MKITDLLKKDSIDLNVEASNKEQILKKAVELMAKNGNIKDTYKEDYLQGKSLINHLQNNLNKQIKEQTNEEYTVKIDKNLDDFNSKLKEIIINEDDLLNI